MIKTKDKELLQIIADKIVEQQAIYAPAYELSLKLQKYLEEICGHPETYTKEFYSPGSYYDKETWDTYEYCTICGQNLGLIKTDTGGYG